MNSEHEQVKEQGSDSNGKNEKVEEKGGEGAGDKEKEGEVTLEDEKIEEIKLERTREILEILYDRYVIADKKIFDKSEWITNDFYSPGYLNNY